MMTFELIAGLCDAAGCRAQAEFFCPCGWQACAAHRWGLDYTCDSHALADFLPAVPARTQARQMLRDTTAPAPAPVLFEEAWETVNAFYDRYPRQLVAQVPERQAFLATLPAAERDNFLAATAIVAHNLVSDSDDLP